MLKAKPGQNKNIGKPESTENQVQQFLESIAGVESSYGTNFNHAPDKKFGTAAGAFGIKPEEVRSLPNRLRNRGMNIPPELIDLTKKSNDEITKELNANRGLDLVIGDKLARVILQDADGNMPVSAYKWHKGVLSPAPKNTKDLLSAGEGYTQKVINEMGKGDMRNERFRKLLQTLAGERQNAMPGEESNEMQGMEERRLAGEEAALMEEKEKERQLLRMLQRSR